MRSGSRGLGLGLGLDLGLALGHQALRAEPASGFAAVVAAHKLGSAAL
jgi:hypothetical protein